MRRKPGSLCCAPLILNLWFIFANGISSFQFFVFLFLTTYDFAPRREKELLLMIVYNRTPQVPGSTFSWLRLRHRSLGRVRTQDWLRIRQHFFRKRLGSIDGPGPNLGPSGFKLVMDVVEESLFCRLVAFGFWKWKFDREKPIIDHFLWRNTQIERVVIL